MATDMEAAAKDESVLLGMTTGGEGGGGGAGAEEVALKKGPWTAAEDAVLIDYVTKHGEGNWNAVQRNTGLARCGKSCRLRWANHLRPNLKKGAFSPEEEKLILELHAQYGNKWARMAALLPGRTDNEIKNYWNTRVKRRQRQGLPLYSDDHDRPTTSSTPVTPTGQTHPPSAIQFDFLHQHRHHRHHLSSPTAPPPHSPLSSPLPPKPTFSSLPDPIIPLSSSSTSSPSALPLIFNRPAPLLCNPLGFKRFRTSSGYPLHISPTIPTSASLPDQPVSTQLGGYSRFGYPDQLNSGSSHIYQTPLLLESDRGGVLNQFSNFSTKLELPSNQFSQPVIEPEIKFDMQMNDPALKTSGGGEFLGDLLCEAQALTPRQAASKKRSYLSLNEGNDMFDGCRSFEDFPLASAYWSSNAGLKLKEEAPDLSKSMNDDLSSLLSVMPSTMPVLDWHTGNAAEVSNVQSCGGMPDNNFGLDIKPVASLFPITTTANHNDNSACYSWDNLPRLC